MSLNSEPVPEENDLLRVIDAGIFALHANEDSDIALDTEQVLKSELKKDS